MFGVLCVGVWRGGIGLEGDVVAVFSAWLSQGGDGAGCDAGVWDGAGLLLGGRLVCGLFAFAVVGVVWSMVTA